VRDMPVQAEILSALDADIIAAAIRVMKRFIISKKMYTFICSNHV
jgi:hypothetical protein